MKMKRTSMCFPERMMKSFKEISEFKGICVSELIRRILDEWLEENNKK